MDNTDATPRGSILSLLSEKAVMKSKIYEQSLEVFNVLKELLSEMSNDLNEMLDDKDYKRVRLEYRDRGKYEAELKFADDVLIFSMHTDVFQFVVC